VSGPLPSVGDYCKRRFQSVQPLTSRWREDKSCGKSAVKEVCPMETLAQIKEAVNLKRQVYYQWIGP
jgi:hypothetical protein